MLLPLAYLLVAVAYGFLFFTSRALRPGAPRRPALGARAPPRLPRPAHCPLGAVPAANVSQALSIVAFAVAVVYVFVEWLGNERSTGFWLVSLVFFFSSCCRRSWRARPAAARALPQPALLRLTRSLALLGYAAFVVAAAYAFLFLRLYRELKAGRFSLFFGKLPPLEVLERMMSARSWSASWR